MMRTFTILAVLALASIGQVSGQLGIARNVAGTAANTVAAPIVKTFAQISKDLDASKVIIQNALGGTDPNAQFSTLVPGLDVFNPGQISECYNSSIGKENVDMFSLPIISTITGYYRNIPENFVLEKLPEKVTELFNSMNQIAKHTMSCLGVQKTPFKLGLTKLSDMAESTFKKLCGARADPAIRSKYANRPKPKDDDEATTPKPSGGLRLFRRKRADEPPIEPKCIPQNKGALADSLDYRADGKVTPIKFQDECGSCWTFASLSSLESAYLIKGKTTDGKFDLSEQQLLSCGVDNGCESGGTAVEAYNYVMENLGVTGEKALPYDFHKVKCEKKKRSAKLKDYCLRGIYVSVDGKPETLTDEEIMYAVREFGPVYTTIDGEDSETLRHYKSGIYDYPKCSKETNHAVNIVGWDKDAWIVKNSWSDKWGEDGYFRMKRGQNMCGINTYISYPLV